MIKNNIDKVVKSNKGLNKRDIVEKIEDFINSDKCLEGKVMILYGLRRTGKTTAMQQAIESYDKNKCAFYEIEKSDTFDNIKDTIIKDMDKGIDCFCFDEITKCEDFIDRASILADIFAKEGVKIILTGTDSLGFNFANSELYDRTVQLHTTHIPFAEHCRVLNTNDIDDYIKYGGLMQKSKDGKRVIDYASACKYLDEAVSRNIVNSLRRNSRSTCLDALPENELKTIIEKIVGKYSGSFDKKTMQNYLEKVTVTQPLKSNDFIKIANTDIIYKLALEEKNITQDFLKEINADNNIKTTITDEIVKTLRDMLIDMDVVSATKNVVYSHTDEFGWREKLPRYEYYIIQTAIKYYHLLKGLDFITTSEYYNNNHILSESQKGIYKTKLDEMVKGPMTEQIIVFDTAKILSKDDYMVLKPSFEVNGVSKGEYDMLIYDKKQYKYWGFEIKHTSNPFYKQEQHLQNTVLREIIDRQYGNRENVCVLYRGNPFIATSGTIYLNITDFSLAVGKYKNIDKVFEKLTKNLPTFDIPKNKDEVVQLHEKLNNVVNKMDELEYC